MYVSKGNLVDEGLNPHLVLPFLLSWYGWLSKEQGDSRKSKDLLSSRAHLQTKYSEA